MAQEQKLVKISIQKNITNDTRQENGNYDVRQENDNYVTETETHENSLHANTDTNQCTRYGPKIIKPERLAYN